MHRRVYDYDIVSVISSGWLCKICSLKQALFIPTASMVAHRPIYAAWRTLHPNSIRWRASYPFKIEKH